MFLVAVAAIFLPMLFDGEGVAPPELPPLDPGPVAIEIDDEPMPDMSEVLEARRALQDSIDEAGFSRTNGTKVGEVVLWPASMEEGDLKWAIQVASHGQEELALEFRDRLRKDGYAAFISRQKIDDDILHRVAVGPFIDEDGATDAQAVLDERYQVESVLKRFGY